MPICHNPAHTHHSRYDRLFHRNLRSKQHYPRLGLSHMLADKREEGVFFGNCQLSGCRIFHLDAVHVAQVGRASLCHGHVVERWA